MSTVAGTLNSGGFTGDGDQALNAQLNNPVGIALDASGSLYIADQSNQRIRQVQPSGVISTLAGNGAQALSGDGGNAGNASFFSPGAVAVAANGDYYVADTGNGSIRKVTKAGIISTFAGSSSAQAGFTGDGGPAASALLNGPTGVAVDASGNVYISDFGNNRIRKVDSSGKISTIAGGGVNQGDGGLATAAKLNGPRGIAVDSAGTLYIADTNNHRIRKVGADGIIVTIAGTGTAGATGDGGLATSATLNNPRDIALDAAGNIFIADYFNNRIRKITPNGLIGTITAAGQLAFPTGLAVGPAGQLYVADTQHDVIRLFTPIPVIGGVVSASAFGAFTAIAPGTWIEIYGSNLANSVRGWKAADFATDKTAPTSLDATTVKIGGQTAFVDYVSGGQVNALVPSNVGTGTQAVVVTTRTGSGSGFNITVNATQPGLLAPPGFSIGGRQYVAATFPDYVTFAIPTGAIAGVTSRAAKPGDTIFLWGIGFGQVNPDTPAGKPAPANTEVASTFQVFFGDTEATVQYRGLSPGSYGLYQFNVVVPNVPANAATPLTFKLGGASGSQTLYIAVQN